MTKAAELLDISRELLEEAYEDKDEQQRYETAHRDNSIVEGKAAEALSKAVEAQGLFQRLGDQVGALSAHHQAILAKILKGSEMEALKDAQSQLESAHQSRDRQGMSTLLVAEAEVLLAFGNYRAALESARQGMALAQERGDRSLECYALYKVQFDCCLQLGESEEAFQAMIKACSLCRQISDKKLRGKACMSVARALVTAAPADAEATAREALVAYRALGHGKGEAAALSLISQVLVSRKAFQEALRPAREALELSSKCGSSRQTASAYEALVRAHIGCGEPEEALRVALRGLNDFRSRGDISGQAAMAPMLALSHCAEADTPENRQMAQMAIEDGLRLCEQVKDMQTMAEIQLQASELSLNRELLEQTLAQAQEALMAFRKTGDWRREKRAKAVLSEVYSRRGEPELAPNRPEAMKLAREMADAVAVRNAVAFHGAAERFANLAVSTPPLSKKEHAEIFGEILKRDTAASDFMQAHVPPEVSSTVLTGVLSAGGNSFREVEKTQFYHNFRVGGICYGPRYRAADMAYGLKGLPQGNYGEAHGYAVYQLQDDADDWEFGLRAHPSILDSALQSNSVCGMFING